MAKRAWIKEFNVEQVIKTKGIEIQVDDDGKQMGDIRISKTGVTWYEGKSSKNMTKFSFDELSWISHYKKEVMKAVRQARKKDGN